MFKFYPDKASRCSCTFTEVVSVLQFDPLVAPQFFSSYLLSVLHFDPLVAPQLFSSYLRGEVTGIEPPLYLHVILLVRRKSTLLIKMAAGLRNKAIFALFSYSDRSVLSNLPAGKNRKTVSL